MLSIAYLLVNLYHYLNGNTKAGDPIESQNPEENVDDDQDSDMLRLVKQNVRYASLVLRGRGVGGETTRPSPHVCELSGLLQEGPAGWLETPLLHNNSREMVSVSPTVSMNLSKWTSYLDQQNYPVLPLSADEDTCYLLFEAQHPADEEEFLNKSLSLPVKERRKISDFVSPIAWKSGDPFGIVAECNISKFVELAEVFFDGKLFMDDMLDLKSIISVSVEGHAVNLLRTDSRQDGLFPPMTPSPHPSPVSGTPRPSVSWQLAEDDQVIHEQEIFNSDTESNESLAEEDLDELANSIKADNIPPTFDFSSHDDEMADFNEQDFSGDNLDQGGEDGGEALSPSVEELAPEVLTPAKRKETIRSKPPNILIYSGKKDAYRLFTVAKDVFEHCINRDKYVLYHLKHDNVSTTPWMENTAVLLICSEKVYEGVDEVFLKYMQKGGTVISFNTYFDNLLVNRNSMGRGVGVINLNYRHWQKVSVICGRYNYNDCDIKLDSMSVDVIGEDKNTGNAVMLEITDENSGGVAILSQVNLDKDPIEMAISPEIFAILKRANKERFDILRDVLCRVGIDCSPSKLPPFTPCYLISLEPHVKTTFLKSVTPRLNERLLKSEKLSLCFTNSHSEARSSEATADFLPVVEESSQAQTSSLFDLSVYKENLTSKNLGNMIMFTEVIATTMNLFESLMFSVPEEVGLIAIAKRQVSGQGRGGNLWLSPEGCAMFSLHVHMSLNTALGHRVSYIQHITSLAVVEAVRTLRGYEDIDLRLKWPNDIYFGGNMKLGGVIVNSSIMMKDIHINIGCGFNVSNKDPTVCINDLVQQHNIACGTKLEPFSTEQLIARTVSRIDTLIDLFQKEGKDAFLERYYKYWLHDNASVILETEGGKQARVVGVDDYGFLSVQTTEGEVISVHPDGNSFDMMRGLIVPKNN